MTTPTPPTPTPTPPAPTPTPPTDKLLKEIIPPDLHDKPYMKDFLDKPQNAETLASVFKKLDGAESLIGRKIGIPAADAKPEEVEKFYGSLRPGKPEEYEFKLGETADKDFEAALRASFHSAGVSKHQATKFLESLMPVFQEREKKVKEAQAKADGEFDELVKKSLGPDNAKVIDRAKWAIDEHVPAALKAAANKLSNENLAIVAGVVDAILVKYAPEDVLTKGGETRPAGDDRDALMKEALKLQGSDAWKNFRHPDHESTVKRVTEIFANPVFK